MVFEDKKKAVLVEIPYCLKNKIPSKQFITKFGKFTNDTINVLIKWLTKKVKTLFKINDKSLLQACKIDESVYPCGESYIGETIWNVSVSSNEHNSPANKSNPSKQVKDNLDHAFNWSVLANARKDMFQQEFLEAYYIALEEPTLNEQLEPNRLNLFQNGVTWSRYHVNILTLLDFKF